MSQDTYPYDYNNPLELNRYGYTANNPVNGVDPSGMAASLSHSNTGGGHDYLALVLNAVSSVAAFMGQNSPVVFAGAVIVGIAALIYLAAHTMPGYYNPPKEGDRSPEDLLRELIKKGRDAWDSFKKILERGIPWVLPFDRTRPDDNDPDEVVRHYTSQAGYAQIVTTLTLNTSSVDYGEQRGLGVFFTSTNSFRGGFNRYLIQALVGIDYDKTSCYVDVSKQDLAATGQGFWIDRYIDGLTQITEHIFASPLPAISIATSIMRSGATYDLDNSNPVERCTS